MFYKKFSKKNLIIVSCFFVLLVLTATVHRTSAIDNSASINELRDHLNEKAPERMEYFNIPGASIAVIENGEVKWHEHYGQRDRKGNKPVDDDTYFRAESITKSVTAWGIMNLVERGIIGVCQHSCRINFFCMYNICMYNR